jgi:hypothetical protein
MDPGGLPDGATGFVDFTALTFYTSGDETEIGDVIQENAGFGAFNPANIVEGTGLVGGVDSKPVFAGEALSQILAGATLVFDFTLSSGAGGYFSLIAYDDPDFNLTWGVAIASTEAAFDSSLNADAPSTLFSDIALGIHRAAWTITSSGVKVSIDGGAVVADAGTAGDFILLNASGMEVFANAVLRSIAIYPPKSNAEMQALSAL